MNYRPFGKTGLMVSEIGFGCARLGGIFQGASASDQVRTLRTAYDRGITFYDTSDMYCQGESEELLGIAFRELRGSVILTSKAGYNLPRQRKVAARLKPLLRPLLRRAGIKREHMPPGLRGTLSQNFAASYLTKAVEGSLRRLRTDYLDLFQLHSPPTEVLERGDFIATLDHLKRQGKIRYTGVSCETTEDALVCLRYPELSSLQVRLNVLDTSAIGEVVPLASAKGVAIIARECFAGGVLVTPLDARDSEGTSRAVGSPLLTRRSLARIQRIATRYGRPLSQLALFFVLGLDGVSTSLLGMRSVDHVLTNLDHLAGPRLSAEESDTIHAAATAGHHAGREYLECQVASRGVSVGSVGEQ